jgi:hypothetical protein
MDIFNRMQNGDGEWVWAKAAREDWDLVREELLGSGQALGVGRAAPLPFVRGPLTIAHKASGALKWDIFGERYDMERPGSYAVSGDLCVGGGRLLTWMGGVGSDGCYSDQYYW